jgi:hypothetical protein
MQLSFIITEKRPSEVRERMRRWTLITVGLLLLFAVPALSQKTTRGIVVDSLSMRALQGVHVRLRSSERGTVTDKQGIFRITTRPADTLVLTLVGYNTLEIPLFFEEEDILIRLGERIRILPEITIKGNRLYASEIVRAPRTQPHAMSVSDAFSSPWEYFSKGQREKRKVVKLINENNRIRTYIEVVNDQELREDIIAEHGITETDFYNGLASFNQQSSGTVLYSTDPYEIMASLKEFFNRLYTVR